MANKEQRNGIVIAVVAVVLILTGSCWLTWKVTSVTTRNEAYAAGKEVGQEAGKGQLKAAVPGEVYELKLVGVKDGNSYELEGSYGYSINNQTQMLRIPANAKAGDSVACVRPQDGIVIVSRRP